MAFQINNTFQTSIRFKVFYSRVNNQEHKFLEYHTFMTPECERTYPSLSVIIETIEDMRSNCGITYTKNPQDIDRGINIIQCSLAKYRNSKYKKEP